MTLQAFVALSARAWTLTVLSLIATGTPARLSPLATAASASRAALAASLDRCVELGLLTPNTGHGHPLRPAFALTNPGRRVADLAQQLLHALDSDEERILVRRSWTLPVLVALDQQRSFGELRRILAPITDRALSITLKELRNARWIQRQSLDDGSRRQVAYRCKGRGQRVRDMLAAIVEL
ncbi:MAG: winged helix-turn-helix transcriptional regulator [Pseudomonadota bacterium]